MSYEYREYPFSRPPELDGKSGTYAVAVVGGGPVGMATALGLARLGVPSVVLEAGSRVADGSRAICISRRSLEILDRLGCGRAVADKGLWWTGGTSYYRKTPVFRLEMPHSSDCKYPPFVNIQQYYLEDIMLEAVADCPLIDYRWRSRVSGIEQGKTGVTLQVEMPEGGYALKAGYAVAADGARSAARELLGLKLKGESYEGRYLIADIELETTLSVERRAWFDPAWNPGGTVLMHAQPDNIWRLDYQLRDDEDDVEELVESRIRDRIRRHLDYIGEEGDWSLQWSSVYRAHALLLDDFRAGRVFFAGDAAHLVPIFGVRGLNSGYEDAHNIAWKLAAAVNGAGADKLLDSYSPERREVTVFGLAQARKSTQFMTPPSRGYQLLRQAVLSLAVGNAFVRGLVNPRQVAPTAYGDTPLLGPDEAGPKGQGEAPDEGRPGGYFGGGLVRLGGAPCYVHDVLGEGFSILYFSASGTIPRTIGPGLKSLGGGAFPTTVLVVGQHAEPTIEAPLKAVQDPVGGLQARYGLADGGVLVIRPDGHILARLARFDANRIETLIKACLGGKIGGKTT